MNKDFKHLMYLYACGAKGQTPQKLEDADFIKITQLASIQGAWQTVFYAIKSSENASLMPAEILKEQNSNFLLSCIKNQEKLEFINSIIQKLEQSGISVCVLKGQSLANLYAQPDTRISGDVDLLVDIKNEQQAISILRKEGFEIEIRPDSSNHSKCTHPIWGVVELHISLYYDIMSDVWFDNIQMLTEDFVTSDGIKTLGITDNYIYVALHAVKHFLSNGLGLRQIMDLLLFTKKHKDEIDKARVNYVFSHLKYQGFIDNLTGIGIKYLGFKKDELFDCEYNEKQMEEILEDVQAGGLFGKNEKTRKDFFELYNSLRFDRFKNESLEEYMTKWRRESASKKVSFGIANMKKHYEFVQDKPYLLPLAYCKHISKIIKTISKRRKLVKDVIVYKAPDANNENIQKRLKLIKDLGMI